jgi:hypothetical protein
MSRDRHIQRGWHCDSCGELFRSFEDGRVEWLSVGWLCEGEEPASVTCGLRLVHARNINANPSVPHGCEYNPREEFRKSRSLVEGLSLASFSGADGLVLMLSMLAQGEFPTEQLIELAKRLHVPGYEQARGFFSRAVSEQVIVPAIGPGYYLQSEIRDVLQWVALAIEEPDTTTTAREED